MHELRRQIPGLVRLCFLLIDHLGKASSESAATREREAGYLQMFPVELSAMPAAAREFLESAEVVVFSV